MEGLEPSTRSGDGKPGGDADRADGRTGGRRRLLMVGVPLLLLAAAIAAAALLVATQPEVSRNPVEERVWLVSAVPVEIVDARPSLELYGEVVAGRLAELRPLVAGQVVEIGPHFEEGGKVRMGELLLAIDRFEFEAAVREAESQLAEARARLRELNGDLDAERRAVEQDRALVELRRREVQRREDLRARGTGTIKSLDDARLALTQQEQQLVAREQSIASLEARIAQQEAVIDRLEVQLARAERDLADTRLVAPFDAFVLEADTALGKRLSVSDHVATLVEADSMEARFHMSDDAYGRLVANDGFVGKEAVVVWRSAAQDFAFQARIARVSGRFDPASGGVKVFAEMQGVGLDTPLRPGAFVEVRMPDRRFEDVVRLPEIAVHRPMGRSGASSGQRRIATVYVALDGRLEDRSVEIVGRDGADMLVRGGLDEGELVVTTDFAQIAPGVRVKVR